MLPTGIYSEDQAKHDDDRTQSFVPGMAVLAKDMTLRRRKPDGLPACSDECLRPDATDNPAPGSPLKGPFLLST